MVSHKRKITNSLNGVQYTVQYTNVWRTYCTTKPNIYFPSLFYDAVIAKQFPVRHTKVLIQVHSDSYYFDLSKQNMFYSVFMDPNPHFHLLNPNMDQKNFLSGSETLDMSLDSNNLILCVNCFNDFFLE